MLPMPLISACHHLHYPPSMNRVRHRNSLWIRQELRRLRKRSEPHAGLKRGISNNAAMVLLSSTCPALLQHLLPHLSVSVQVSPAQGTCLQCYHHQTQHGAVIDPATDSRVQLPWEEMSLSRLVHTQLGLAFPYRKQ